MLLLVARTFDEAVARSGYVPDCQPAEWLNALHLRS